VWHRRHALLLATRGRSRSCAWLPGDEFAQGVVSTAHKKKASPKRGEFVRRCWGSIHPARESHTACVDLQSIDRRWWRAATKKKVVREELGFRQPPLVGTRLRCLSNPRAMASYACFCLKVGIASTSPPLVGTRFRCLSNPRRGCNYDNHQSTPHMPYRTHRNCEDELQRDWLRSDCLAWL
jgi:hypothetical protein